MIHWAEMFLDGAGLGVLAAYIRHLAGRMLRGDR